MDNKTYKAKDGSVKSDDKRITVWEKPGHKFFNCYGVTTFLVWLTNEQERFAKSGQELVFIENIKGKIALERVA